jgi:hypothetical protein
MGRPIVIGAIALALAAGAGLGVLAAGAVEPSGSPAAPSATGQAQASPSPSPSPTPTPTAPPTPTPVPTPTPTASPPPTPAPTQAPLTGRLVRPAVAERHPIAMMIDDHPDARPQSGFNAASVVWQAPAEGGIPRYMLIFQDQIPELVGPVRSARLYYIAWAAEWDAVYGHSGGSPQALQTLREKGQGQLVYNADEFRWGGGLFYYRSKDRFAPHNVYITGKKMRQMAKRIGAPDGPMKAAWKFGPDAPPELRPKGGKITVAYAWNKITYHYDRKTNTYLRSVTGQDKQIDQATGERVAPKNVVVMLMSFGPLNDGSHKHRLEANFIGTGRAWIATNGHTIKGTWRKDSMTKPTRFYDADGKQVRLTVGQTFVQVMQTGTKVSIKDGTVPVPPLFPGEWRDKL